MMRVEMPHSCVFTEFTSFHSTGLKPFFPSCHVISAGLHHALNRLRVVKGQIYQRAFPSLQSRSELLTCSYPPSHLLNLFTLVPSNALHHDLTPLTRRFAKFNCLEKYRKRNYYEKCFRYWKVWEDLCRRSKGCQNHLRSYEVTNRKEWRNMKELPNFI